MVTRTYGPLHFTDLDPRRFEDMILQMVYRMRHWERLEHFGAAGSDDGIDLNGVELLENGKRIIHHFQCKRYGKISKNQLVKIVIDYEKSSEVIADYYYLVCACDPSKKAIDGFNEACEKVGIKHYMIWSSSYLETLLYAEYHDILFSFFNINMLGIKNSTIAACRRNLTLKKRMHIDFTKQNFTDEERNAIQRKGEYWRKFICNDILIRSINDKSYPEGSGVLLGYYKTEIYNWYHNGLEVRTLPYSIDAKIQQQKNCADAGLNNSNSSFTIYHLEVFGCIPFENIIDYDIEGDEIYACPHLFCDYSCGSTPYETIRYRTQSGILVNKDDIVEIL